MSVVTPLHHTKATELATVTSPFGLSHTFTPPVSTGHDVSLYDNAIRQWCGQQSQLLSVVVQVQIHGGSVTDTLVPETTHIVIDTGTHVAHASVKPLEVLRGVTSRLGGLQGLRLLRRLMLSGQLTLVAPRYAFHMTLLCTTLAPLY